MNDNEIYAEPKIISHFTDEEIKGLGFRDYQYLWCLSIPHERTLLFSPIHHSLRLEYRGDAILLSEFVKDIEVLTQWVTLFKAS